MVLTFPLNELWYYFHHINPEYLSLKLKVPANLLQTHTMIQELLIPLGVAQPFFVSPPSF
eukprot:12050854-Prorocentrum_lima.AAC.1